MEEQIKKVIGSFNSFTKKYKGATDFNEVLDYGESLDDPDALNRELSKMPSAYAYYATLKRNVDCTLDDVKNKISQINQEHYERAVNNLKNSGAKTPTQKAIDAETLSILAEDQDYQQLKKLERRYTTYSGKIGVIEKAISLKLDTLRTIANLVNGMMNTGIYVYKNKQKFSKKGEY